MSSIIKINNETFLYLMDFLLILYEIKGIVGSDHSKDDGEVEAEVLGVRVKVHNHSFPGYVF